MRYKFYLGAIKQQSDTVQAYVGCEVKPHFIQKMSGNSPWLYGNLEMIKPTFPGKTHIAGFYQSFQLDCMEIPEKSDLVCVQLENKTKAFAAWLKFFVENGR